MEVKMESVRGEYIFLLDRSYSMEGDRIESAKKALTLFIKSLPIDTYFNVFSFGDYSKRLFPESVKYELDKINDAITQIKGYDADMGVTQIEDQLKRILSSSIIPSYPKQIFILTDGQVSNTGKVIDLLEKTSNIQECTRLELEMERLKI